MIHVQRPKIAPAFGVGEGNVLATKVGDNLWLNDDVFSYS